MRERYGDGINALERKLLGDKGGNVQKEFLKKLVLQGPDFARYLDEEIKILGKESNISDVAGHEKIAAGIVAPKIKLTAADFLKISNKTQLEMYRLWKGVSMDDANSATFWASVNCMLLENEVIPPIYLAMSSKNPPENEAAAKRLVSTAKGKMMDTYVRNFLRNFARAKSDRGVRGLYIDNKMASAWWQCRIAEEGGRADWATTTLPVIKDRAVWEPLMEKMSAQVSVLGEVSIRSGIALFLTSDKRLGSYNSTNKKKKFIDLLLHVGAMSAWRALEYMHPEKICQEIKKIMDGMK